MRAFAALYFASIAAIAGAFVAPTGRSLPSRSNNVPLALAASPLDTLFAVLKEGKVGLVKSLAGDYDSAAIRSKIDGLVSSEPVLMLSFTT